MNEDSEPRIIIAFKIKPAAKDHIRAVAGRLGVNMSEAARQLMAKGIEHENELTKRVM